jgi:hypothetical protein
MRSVLNGRDERGDVTVVTVLLPVVALAWVPLCHVHRRP